jgi:hypothetical protein
MVLDQVGDPADIAAEARERFGVPTLRPGAVEVGALILLPIGGIILPGLGWIVGVILLWSSRIWTTGEKVAATLLVPGGLALPVFLLLATSRTSTCVSHLGVGGRTITTCSTTSAVWDVLFAVGTVLLFVIPVAMAIYLGVQMRARSTAGGTDRSPTRPAVA